MAERTNQTPESSAPTAAEAARLMSRRKFTRAGLATPVVLSTLVSKPVLASSARNCTISGQVSGNVSSPGDADCAKLGYSPTYWLLASVWPGGLIKGDLPDGACSFQDKTEGRLFEAEFGVRAFARQSSGDPPACSVVAGSTADHTTPGATLFQVLNTGSELGRQAVASLLNAYAQLPEYPLSREQVVIIFNKVWSGQGFRVNSSARAWDEDQVVSYLQSINYMDA